MDHYLSRMKDTDGPKLQISINGQMAIQNEGTVMERAQKCNMRSG